MPHNKIIYNDDNVNYKQVVTMLSAILALHVPVTPPMKRILLSLIWTDLPINIHRGSPQHSPMTWCKDYRCVSMELT